MAADWAQQPGAGLWRSLTTSTAAQQQQQPKQQQQQPQTEGSKEEFDSLELTQERIHAITDKIPQKPVGIVEGTSYTAIILAAFGVLAYIMYQFVTSFLLEPVYMTCFSTTLARLREDPRISVRLGDNITGYGQDSQNRGARQHVPHVTYKDQAGVEHVRLAFHMRGSGGYAEVKADMYKDAAGAWEYTYLIVDVAAGQGPPQRLNIILPK